MASTQRTKQERILLFLNRVETTKVIESELGKRHGRPTNTVQNFAQSTEDTRKRTIEIVAEKSDSSNKKTYE